MELADLNREEWWALLRAVQTQVKTDRAYFETQGWARKNQGLFEAQQLQDLHDRLFADFQVRSRRGEVKPQPPLTL